MIRQLRRLTQPVPAFGTGAVALAVYAGERDGQFFMRSAGEQGYEGVACVDDAARAVVLYSKIWRRHRFAWARREAEGLLKFTCAMQMPDGAFVNFIRDWSGRRQLDTPTSNPRGGPWHARAMHALACGLSAFGDGRYATAFDAGLELLDQSTPYLDVRAVGVLAALEFYKATGSRHVAERARVWAEEILAARIGDVLPDRAGDAHVHLWGHLQEAALARVGMEFDRQDLISAAARSADAVLAPPTREAFGGPRALPFDVSSTVAGLEAVGAATREPRYAELASLARAWFDERNAACAPAYDRVRGCVYDGIDGTTLSRNSGAESNIEGGLALIDSLPWDAFGEVESPEVAAAFPST